MPRLSELFIGFLLVLHLLEVEESIAQSESGRLWEFFEPSSIHPINFFDKLTAH